MNRGTRTFLAVVAAVSLAAPLPARKKPPEGAPKLVVLLVVDQMRADYITRYGQQWKHGLRRLLAEGAWFSEAAYPYLNTVTCAGHATISTGTYPSAHGMVLNAWWDRGLRKTISCTDDASSPLVGYGDSVRGNASIRHLKARTFADYLIQQEWNKKSRVVSYSMKARSAIMLGGRDPDAVTWFDDRKGVWVTSRAYTLAGVPFVHRFARQNPVKRDWGKTWIRLLPESAYLYRDDDPAELPGGMTASFPHRLTGNGKPDEAFYDQWRTSPFADSYLGEMARDAVDRLKLGQREFTDLLAISFSALDSVGHEFGPRSHEVQDVLARLDLTIGELLDHLDSKVGAPNYVVALSADHGVATLPEHIREGGGDAGRFTNQEVHARAEDAIRRHFGPGKYITRALYTDLYLEPEVFERLAANPEAMKAVLEAVGSASGVQRVFRRDELAGKETSEDPMERAAALSHFPGRSGDLILVPRANWFIAGNVADHSTTHGTANWYDARVPVILYGAGIRAGKYGSAASPADMAPTLAVLCRFTLPGVNGRVLSEALLSHATAGNGRQP